MAETTPNAFDRFNDTLRNLDDQIQELRDRVEENGRQFRADFRKRAEKVETQLRKSPLYRRAEQTRKDFESQVGKTRDQVSWLPPPRSRCVSTSASGLGV